MHPAEYAVAELPQIFSALHEKHIFELSILNSSFPVLRRRFAASVKRSRSKRTLFAPVYNLHSAARGTITSRGAELGSRKTKPLHFRQSMHVAIVAPARSFRGRGGIETPAFLVLLTPKEHRPRSRPNTPSDAHRCGFELYRFKGSCFCIVSLI